MDDDLIYKTRQVLEQSGANLPPRVTASLAAARQKALNAAQLKAGQPHLRKRFSSPTAIWGVGLTFASFIGVLIALNGAQRTSLDLDIGRIAAIDQKMIVDRLPVQAYLDPGFLVFQEEGLGQPASTSVTSLVNGATIAIREFWSLDQLFPGAKNSQTLAWTKLTNNQREALAPLESLWTTFEPTRKKKWLKIADRFHLLTPNEQARAQERMQEWVSMPASDRQQARAIFDSVVEAVPEEVRIMKWNEYQKLSPAERARLVELAAQKIADASPTPEQKVSPPGPAQTRPRSALSATSDKPF